MIDIDDLQKKLEETVGQAPKMRHHDETRYKFLYFDEVMFLLESRMKSKDTSWQMSEALGEVARLIQEEASVVELKWDRITR